VELRPFTEGWKDLGLGDDDLLALQVMLMLDPKAAPVVKSTGGLRKTRFAPASWGTGKSGAARIAYVYLQEYGTVVLAIAYSKNEKDDLTPEEKSSIRAEIVRIRRQFDSGVIR
jgi:hypothetical protein